MDEFDAILIAGPTASGKSSLALGLAQALGGVILNADSMQVYDGLRLLTARPSDKDEALVPHRIYGMISPDDAYSVGRWVEDVAIELNRAKRDGLVPIIVGGTGLYFKALLEGLSPVPDVPPEVREKWRQIGQEASGPELHAILSDKDPEMAERLRINDPQRIVRALEVLEATGRSLKDWQEQPGTPLLAFDRVKTFVVAPEREVLYARCDHRFDLMMEAGAVDEVMELVSRGLSDDLPLMRALGVRPLCAYLQGNLSRDDAIELSKRDTRRYAKRQFTWLRGNMLTWKWLSAQDMERMSRNYFSICED